MSGRSTSILALAATVVLATPIPAAQTTEDSGSPYFVHRDDWAGTMLASRARYQELYQGEDVAMGPWFATAPLPAESFADTKFTDETIELAALDIDGESLWVERPEWTDGEVHQLPKIDSASTYLYRTIDSERAISLTAGFGSDDGIEVWLNGVKVHSKDTPRGAAPNQDRAALNLLQGENRLLIKIYNISGGHAFCFQLERDPLALLWDQMTLEYAAECDRMTGDLPDDSHLDWFRAQTDAAVSPKLLNSVLVEAGIVGGELNRAFKSLCDASTTDDDPRWLDLYENLCLVREAQIKLNEFDMPALRRAIEDLASDYPDQYDEEYLLSLGDFEENMPALKEALVAGNLEPALRATGTIARMEAFRRRALLVNPRLDFEEVFVI